MISFESDEAYIRKLRERLQTMGDEELIKFGKYARSLAGIRVSGLPAHTRFSWTKQGMNGADGIRNN